MAEIEKRTADAVDLSTMLEADPDDAMTGEVSAELDLLEKELDRRELELLYSDPYSDHPAILGIHAGAGGTDFAGLGGDADAHVHGLGGQQEVHRGVPRRVGRR